MNITKEELEKIIDTRVAQIFRAIIDENGTGLAGLDINKYAVERITESLEEKHNPALHTERSIEYYGKTGNGKPKLLKTILV